MSNRSRSILLILVALLLNACGYKPVSHYTNQIIEEPLYLNIELSSKEPDIGVSLKDELYRAIAYRLGVKTTQAATAASSLAVSYDGISYTALGYDANGYVERYRVNMVTVFKLLGRNHKISRKIKTTYEANVTPSALESSRAKQEAIKACAEKAVDQFIAFIAAKAAISE